MIDRESKIFPRFPKADLSPAEIRTLFFCFILIKTLQPLILEGA